ncbi:putative 115 kDa protein in type-1 like protein [Argiope bruennichi]|uniref:Putative 115 kDa protein in type-1 like protein n=1 Tax=Argiope bruennichi TaxID=94029 RepID=A0A8T0FG69_ARGBR|nr:putative 115 kDa protein in type-1 like protein [Argiope bruennichi]
MTTNITLNSSFSSNKNFNILQINLGRTKAATTHLHPAVVKLKTDILLVQEPYVYNNKIQGLPMSWNIFTSTSNKAAIFIPQTIHKVITVAKLENTIAVKLHTDNKPITLISAYSSPIADINQTLQEIQDIIRMIPNENFLVGADLNGHNPLWGYHRTNTRGVAIMDFLLANNLYINNSSDAPPTFTRNTDVGWPDLTFCSQEMITKVASWEVLEEPSFSDHHFIQITEQKFNFTLILYPSSLDETRQRNKLHSCLFSKTVG